MDKGSLIARLLIAAGILLLLLHLGKESHAQHQQSYHQVRGVLDVRTTFSDGTYSVEGLVQLAKQRGIQALVINDHDRLCLEYGLPPFRNLLKKKVEHNSINRSGAEEYLQAIRDAQKRNPDMIIIPGTESSPFYYWSGSPFDQTLTAHNHEKRILTVGLDKPESYRNLPILHNDLPYGRLDLLNGGFVFFLAALVPCIFLLRWPGIFRWVGIAALAISVLGLINAGPFKGHPFDAYHGNPGIAPYQHFIDHVGAAGGLTFWNYPETRSGTRKMGPISVKTPPYPEVLVESKNYTGFAALYGDNITAIEPGGLWDFTLIEYCNGLRERPPWGIATGDFHGESKGTSLGDYQTVFLVRQKTKPDVLSALKTGKMYAVQGRIQGILKLDDFSVSGPAPDPIAVSGDEIHLRGKPKVRIAVSGADLKNKRIRLRVIRNGAVVKTFEGDLPARLEFEDQEIKPGQRVYYRADVKGEGRLVTNPIFVKGVTVQ